MALGSIGMPGQRLAEHRERCGRARGSPRVDVPVTLDYAPSRGRARLVASKSVAVNPSASSIARAAGSARRTARNTAAPFESRFPPKKTASGPTRATWRASRREAARRSGSHCAARPPSTPHEHGRAREADRRASGRNAGRRRPPRRPARPRGARQLAQARPPVIIGGIDAGEVAGARRVERRSSPGGALWPARVSPRRSRRRDHAGRPPRPAASSGQGGDGARRAQRPDHPEHAAGQRVGARVRRAPRDVEQPRAGDRVVTRLDRDAEAPRAEAALAQDEPGGLGHLLRRQADAALQRKVGHDQPVRSPAAAVEARGAMVVHGHAGAPVRGRPGAIPAHRDPDAVSARRDGPARRQGAPCA